MKNQLNILILLSAFASISAFADFVAVVNPGVADAVSKEDAKQIMLTNKTAWADGKKIAIIALSPDSADADSVDKEFMGMTATQAKKHWLTKVFSGILSGQPPALDSPEEVAEKVAATPGAFGIVPKGSKVGKAKVIELK